MAAEHTTEAVEHAGHRQPAKPGAVRDLAEAIAEQIAAQQVGDSTLSGSFDAEIVYNNIEYALTVKAPTPADDDPGFWSVTGTRTDLATKESSRFLTFEFTDSGNWKAGAGLPLPITFSNGFEINKLYGEFSMTTTATDGPEAEG